MSSPCYRFSRWDRRNEEIGNVSYVSLHIQILLYRFIQLASDADRVVLIPEGHNKQPGVTCGRGYVHRLGVSLFSKFQRIAPIELTCKQTKIDQALALLTQLLTFIGFEKAES